MIIKTLFVTRCRDTVQYLLIINNMEIQAKQLDSSSNLQECVNISECIICQTNTGEKLTSTEHGMKRIRDRADEVKGYDIVYKRLKSINGTPKFVYHMNTFCYRTYTRRLSDKSKSPTGDQIGNSKQKLRSKLTTRSKPKIRKKSNYYEARRKEICVICNKKKHKGVEVKFRLCEEGRVRHFLKATFFLQDNVYTRTCDLTDTRHILAADLFSHKNCMKAYLNEYDRKLNNPNVVEKSVAKLKKYIFSETFK